MNYLIKPILILAAVIGASAKMAVANANNPNNINKYSNMYVLGDSLVDTGAFANHLGTRNKTWDNVTPAEFHKPHYNKSFSNGKVASEILADKLGITLTPAAYVWDGWHFARGNSRAINVKGNNYAAAGAQILATERGFSMHGLKQMMRGELFTNRFKLKKQVEGLKAQHKTVKQNELVLIVMGTNDVIAAVDKYNQFGREAMNNEKRTLSRAIGRLISQLTILKTINAKRIIVANVPDFSVAPKYKQTSLKRNAASALVKYFNNTLKLKLDSWNKVNNNAARLFDLDYAFRMTLNNKFVGVPGKNWQDNATKMMEYGDIWSRNFKPPLVNGATLQTINNFAFFDELHVTGDFHKDVGEKLHQFVNRRW